MQPTEIQAIDPVASHPAAEAATPVGRAGGAAPV